MAEARAAIVALADTLEQAVNAQAAAIEQSRTVVELIECVQFARLGHTVCQEAGGIHHDLANGDVEPVDAVNDVHDFLRLFDLAADTANAPASAG